LDNAGSTALGIVLRVPVMLIVGAVIMGAVIMGAVMVGAVMVRVVVVIVVHLFATSRIESASLAGELIESERGVIFSSCSCRV
jgi:hypothetical protein